MSDDLRQIVHDAIEQYQGIDGLGPDWIVGDEEPWLITGLVLEAVEPLVGLLDAALTAVTVADSLDMAQGIAHAALHREEYHGLDALDDDPDARG